MRLFEIGTPEAGSESYIIVKNKSEIRAQISRKFGGGAKRKELSVKH